MTAEKTEWAVRRPLPPAPKVKSGQGDVFCPWWASSTIRIAQDEFGTQVYLKDGDVYLRLSDEETAELLAVLTAMNEALGGEET